MVWTSNARHARLAFALVVSLTGSCGDLNDSDSDLAPGAGEDDGPGDDGTRRDAGKPSGNNGDGTAPPVVPEQEQALAFETPQAGKSSVYVPDPATNRVSVVNAGTFNVENVAVGTQPRYAATVPGQDIAVVLNVGTQDAALLRTSEAGVTAVERVAVGHDANAIAIAPDAVHALVYFNASASAVTDADSFQDLTVIDLAVGAVRARRVSVGFKPRAVQFSSDGKRAFVVTEDGISILDFAALDSNGATILPLIPLGDGLGDAQSVDVQITPDGKFALARRDTESTVRLIDLASGQVESLDLATQVGPLDGGVPDGLGPELTDLDLAPDGTFAIAVLRARGVLVRIAVPEGFRDVAGRSIIPVADAMVGSVTLSRSGTRAVGYTTAAPVESVTVFDLTGTTPPRGIRLRKTVRAVALSDDGSRALVLHGTVPSAQGNVDEATRIAASEGYSLVDTGSGFSKLQLTPARVASNGLLLTPDGKRVFALLASSAVKAVEMADLDSFQISSRALTTPPTSLGFVPGQLRVFVGQAGTGGITFLNASTGEAVRTVSGFEIASRIRQ